MESNINMNYSLCNLLFCNSATYLPTNYTVSNSHFLDSILINPPM